MVACRRHSQADVGMAPCTMESVVGITSGKPMDRFTPLDELRTQWIDQYVVVNPDRIELKRFGDTVGRIVTVNYNGKALVDFQDGGWYDITASTDFLRKLDPTEGEKKYKNVNSALAVPCTSLEPGSSYAVHEPLPPTTPTLGISIGHHYITNTFGGEVIRNDRITHGKTSPIYHDGKGVFRGPTNPYEATRYHSLAI